MLSEIIELTRTVNKHRCEYAMGQATISDPEYDVLYNRLMELEKQYPEHIQPDSPIGLLSTDIGRSDDSVKHEVNMFSLETHYGLKRLESTSTGQWIIEPKVDGLAIELIYRDNVLVQAITRGDGEYGELRTEQAAMATNVPRTLMPMGSVCTSVRGELYIPTAQLAEANRLLDKHYKSCRSAAAALVNSNDASLAEKAGLMFVPYDASFKDDVFGDYTDKIKRLLRIGFTIALPYVDNSTSVIDAISGYVDGKLGKHDISHLPTDGLVFKLRDTRQWRGLGTTGKFYNYGFAWKTRPEEAVTRIKDIIIQVSRTGALTPVGIYEPIKIKGHTFNRVNLVNQEFITRHGVGIGSAVRIGLAGDIIPELQGIAEGDKTPTYNLPGACPSCDSKAFQTGATLRCLQGWECPDQAKQAMYHIVTKPVLNLKGLGDKTMTLLYEAGIATSPVALLSLIQSPKPLLHSTAFTANKAERIHESLIRATQVELYRKLLALSIPNVGQGAAKSIASQIGTLYDLLDPETIRLLTTTDAVRSNLLGAIKSPTIKQLIALLEPKEATS